MIEKIQIVILVSLGLGLAACQKQDAEDPIIETKAGVGEVVTTLYYNAEVVTVNDAQPSAEAVAVRDGKILAVGSIAEVEAVAGPDSTMRDMGGRTLVPGLIDAHGHFTMTGRLMEFANLKPPPIGPVNRIADLQDAMRERLENNPDLEWLLGWGYDDSLLDERRHPTRDDLDAISASIPIAILHASGHLMVCNSMCLEIAGITAETENPEGGIYRRVDGSNKPNGVMEETAMSLVNSMLPKLPPEHRLAMLDDLQQYYAGFGVTTVQDANLSDADVKLLKQAGEEERLYLDIVGYRYIRREDKLANDFAELGEYQGHFRLGGIKLVLDGSPQGKTAWLTKPYLQPPAGQPPEYAGYPIFKDQEVVDYVTDAFSRNISVMAHANGDAAADQLIMAVSSANKSLGMGDRRTVMIHAQTAREDQIDQMKAQGIIPSYFVAHTFYWGDWHRDSVFGVERASRISPLKSTLDRDMPFTTHNDAPVVSPDMIYLLWTAVNRITRSGKVLGSEQRISPLDALKSMTINAAFQYFEEELKGSIEPGKLADLVVLSGNPLKVDPMSIKDIQVLETIKEGETVFQIDNSNSTGT